MDPSLAAASSTRKLARMTEDETTTKDEAEKPRVMKAYEKILRTQAVAQAAYAAWEKEMVTFSTEFLAALCSELGWPEEGFQRLNIGQHEVPSDGRLAPGGYTDPNGYHFAARLVVGRSWLQLVVTASRAGEETYDVKVGAETFRIALSDKASFAPLVEDIVNEMTKTILRIEAGAQTGAT